jgi:hypothetical protein
VSKLVEQDRLIFVTGGIHTKLGDPEPGVFKTLVVTYKDVASPWQVGGLMPGSHVFI